MLCCVGVCCAYANADLRARVTLTESDSIVFEGGIVNGDAKWNTNLISSCVSPANGLASAVHFV